MDVIDGCVGGLGLIYIYTAYDTDFFLKPESKSPFIEKYEAIFSIKYTNSSRRQNY
jgi:hypothetical protein